MTPDLGVLRALDADRTGKLELLDDYQASRRVGVRPAEIRQAYARGTLPGRVISGRLFIRATVLDAWAGRS